MLKRLSIKSVRNQRGLSSADKGEEVFQIRTSALFGALLDFRFFEIYGVSALTREDWVSVDKGGGVNFSRFWSDVSFMDGPDLKKNLAVKSIRVKQIYALF